MKIEARKKSTGEIRFFAKEAWQMLEKGGHARRNWDFLRRHEIAVPEEIKDWVETADRAGQEDLAVLESAEAVEDEPPQKKGKKRRKKTAKQI